MLFNSYYNGIGELFPRPKRALLSRPSLEEIHHYRSTVEAAILQLLEDGAHPAREEIHARVRLGIEHECQHQELFFTDIKYSLSINPLSPAFLAAAAPKSSDGVTAPLAWSVVDGGLVSIGHDGAGFCFDNEQPRHQVYIAPFELARRLVTNGEYEQFIADGGYQRPELWLSDGWNTVQCENWTAPLYWRGSEEYTLEGWCLVAHSRRSLISVAMRPRPTRDGRGRDYRQSRSGRWPRAWLSRLAPMQCVFIQSRRTALSKDCSSLTMPVGSGPAAPMCRTPDSVRLRVPLVNTMASS